MKAVALALALSLSSCSALTESEKLYAELTPDGQAKIDALASDLSDLAKAIATLDMRGAVREGIEASVSAVSASKEKDPVTEGELGLFGAIAVAISTLVTALRHKFTGPDPRVQKKNS